MNEPEEKDVELSVSEEHAGLDQSVESVPVASSTDQSTERGPDAAVDPASGTAKVLSPLDVKIHEFEGPLDLLLHMIRDNKIDIFDIPITVITEHYLDYLKQMKELDLNISGDFLVMAATLIYIKSKMLLPAETVDDDEDPSQDPRDELVRKLLEYQSFKEAAKELGMLAEERSKIFTRQITDLKQYIGPVEAQDTEFTSDLYELIQAFARLLKEPKKEVEHQVAEEVVSIEEKMEEIRHTILQKGSLRFSELFSKQRTRNLIIASFFAILELCKQKFLTVKQDNTFGEIVLHKVA
jgi:segregation and condensation protein A